MRLCNLLGYGIFDTDYIPEKKRLHAGLPTASSWNFFCSVREKPLWTTGIIA